MVIGKLVRIDIDVNEHEILCNIIIRHKFKVKKKQLEKTANMTRRDY